MADDFRARASQARIELRETEKAFDALRQVLIDKLLGSDDEQSKVRETCYFAICTLDGVRNALHHVVDTGKIEEAVAELTRRGQPTPFALPIRGAA